MRIAALIAAWAVMALLPAPVPAEEAGRAGDLRLEAAWARASIGTSRPGAAYVTIANLGAAADWLLAVETPVAARAEVHETVDQGGVMKMRPAGTVLIPAGGTVALEPGGLHVMLMGLREPLKKGETFPLTLTFLKNGQATVAAIVAGPGATAPPP